MSESLNSISTAELDLQRRIADFIATNCPKLVLEDRPLNAESQRMVLAGTVLDLRTVQDVDIQQAAIAHRLEVAAGRKPNTPPPALETEGGFCVEGYELSKSTRARVKAVLQALNNL